MAWDTNGNASTNPASDFLGTTDPQPLVMRTNAKEAARIDATGKLGIGTTNPQNSLHVGPGTTGIFASRVNAVVASNSPDAGIAIAQNSGVNLLVQASGAGAFIGTTSKHALVLRTGDLDRLVVTASGNLGVGNNNAQNLLHVGPGGSNIATTRVNAIVASNSPDAGIAIAQNSGVNVLLQASGAGAFIGTTSNHALVLRTGDLDRVVVDNRGDVFMAGTLSVAKDVVLTGADCAEHFDFVQASACEPGTVLTIGAGGALEACAQAYDKRAAGVVSGAGTYRPAIVLDKHDSDVDRLPVALFGKVFCKVDAQHAAVEIGDLLTTSATVGHAMKASDPARAFGAVIGKALRGLPGGCGLIPILVALQ
jgi:hypothetical protein